MKSAALLLALALSAPALASPVFSPSKGTLGPPPSSQTPLSPQDETAAFHAAGFREEKGEWRACNDPKPNYVAGEVVEARDINGDGRLDVVISEFSTACFSGSGMGYHIVSKQADGSWKRIDSGPGKPFFIKSMPDDVDGWPDMEARGQGKCFPVMRWDGQAYALNGYQFEGKACKQ